VLVEFTETESKHRNLCLYSIIMYSPETESKHRNLCEEERGIHQTQVNIANTAMSRYLYTPVSLLSHRTHNTVSPLSFSLP
jgi:hypothetical protein